MRARKFRRRPSRGQVGGVFLMGVEKAWGEEGGEVG